MALINCPNCNTQVSDQATRCPGCGYVTHDNCPECGANRALSDDACTKCGFPREGDPPRESQIRDSAKELATDLPDSVGSHSDKLLAACIGPKNTDYYVRMFEKFRSGRGTASWNWPAFFLTIPWLLYRKMWGYTLLYWFGLPIGLVILMVMISEIVQDVGVASSFYYLSYIFVAFVLVPVFANRLYFGHVNNKVEKARQKFESPTDQLREVHRIGGTGGAGAMVAVAFLVVAIIGIIAAIAIPAYQDYTIRAQVSEGLSMASGAKAAVAEYKHDNGVFPSDNRAASLEHFNRNIGQYVNRLLVVNGKIYVTFGKNANANIRGQSIVLAPEVSSQSFVHWDCYSTDIPNKWLPEPCRSD